MKEEEVSMLRVSNIKLNIDDNKSKIKSSLLKKLKIKETDLIEYFIYKESVDARKKGKIDFVYTKMGFKYTYKDTYCKKHIYR